MAGRRKLSPPRPEPAGTFSLVPPEVAARRVSVRNPRGRATDRSARDRTLTELREQTEAGDVLLRALIGAQLTLAVRVFAVFGFLLFGLPALFATYPTLGRFEILGLPLPWVVLGVGVYPLLVLMALLYVRQSERNEAEFVELVERS